MWTGDSRRGDGQDAPHNYTPRCPDSQEGTPQTLLEAWQDDPGTNLLLKQPAHGSKQLKRADKVFDTV